eukprot:5206836-Prorocentrum_lima.AAC.1
MPTASVAEPSQPRSLASSSPRSVMAGRSGPSRYTLTENSEVDVVITKRPMSTERGLMLTLR